MIKQTIFAVSTNEQTPILTGVLCNLEQQNLKFVATDRHRLASKEIKTNYDTEFRNIVISAKTLNEINKIIADQEEPIEIVVTNNQILFKINHILLLSKVLDGTFPDTSKIIPQTFKSELVIKTKLILDSIDRAYLLSREDRTNIVRLTTMDEHTVEISSSSTELGKFKETIAITQSIGEPIKVSFNSKYMLDVLKVIDNESIHIGFTGAMSPIIIKPFEENNVLHLILPYRTVN